MFDTKLLRPDYRRAEREAIGLLNRTGIYQPPVNPVEIAETIGVNVSFVEFTGDSEEVAGLYDCANDSILVNAHEAGVRQTFTIAHELGHRILHREWANSEAYEVLWRDPRRQGKDRFESEANAFAANLLMPRQMVYPYRNLPTASVARIFAVSEMVASYRLQNLYGL